ncbi:unnamed protein product [Hermetia illucens]|uniref:Uncharacterized protein n=2 Tax=Hermetia illucens TaxID=343691 RepID=A0A7R8YS14_HERIL|nr:unnamed protein product [Hermetia illucens]
MELDPTDAGHDDKYYAYNRISAYDPNMCSTARFSPPYNNEQVTETQEGDGYENVILIPCTTTENETQCIERSTISTSEICSTYTVPVSARQYANQFEPPHQGFSSTQNNARESQVKNYQSEPLEPQITQIVLRQSPNGTLYHNYYVTSNVKVELMSSSGDNTFRENFVAVKGSERETQQEYAYGTKIAPNGELIGHLSDANFVQLGHGLIAEQSQEEFLSATYNAIPPSNTAITLHDKDPQRLLLESTMSPLLAAVNDITQRDAELQSYLNQSLGKETELGVFNRNTGFREQRDDYVQTNQSEQVGTNDASSARNSLQVENDEEDFLLVTDKPVESRARASLPTNYLYFGNSPDNSNGDISVFAKREIPARTKFGPFEGELRLSSDVISDVLLIQASNTYPLLLINDTHILDVSNENTCNWMRFVRLAKNYTEQNLLLFEESGKLYFRSCQVIHAKQEIKVGYSESYAKHYDLKTISPTESELREIFNRDHPWPCFECDERFSSSKDLQNHLSIHDIDDELVKPKISRRKKKIRNKHLVDIRKNSIRCLYCNKVFMTNSSLKKHISGHLTGRRTVSNRNCYPYKIFRCETCYKKFATDDKLKAHRLVHIKNDSKPFKCSHCNRCCSTPTALTAHLTSHSLRYFSCVFCAEKFTNVSEFRNHIVTHSVNGTYSCQWCKKKYSEYHLVRKHVRIFHQSFKYPCNECGRKFPNLTFLKRHKLCHSEKFEYLCSQCGKQFKRKDKLREHIQRIHSEKRKHRITKRISVTTSPERSPDQESSEHNPTCYEWNSKRINQREQDTIQAKPLEDYRNYMYKCDDCMLGFKRRGMLVNHMVKRHPNVSIESIPELNLPILKPQSLFFCQYCSKVYKSNAKRKLHILKNHPGEELPPSARTVTEPSQINARTVGNLPMEPHRCHWCYKQYAARNRLVAHHRKAHPDLEFIPSTVLHSSQSHDYMETTTTTLTSAPAPHPTLEPPMDVYRPPCSPENKLLKLSSAALELSSIEDRKFFDLLNERSQSSLQEQTSIPEGHDHHNLNLDDNGNAFSKVDVNFKVVESEFGESSSNGELNRLPQLFEESIACI